MLFSSLPFFVLYSNLPFHIFWKLVERGLQLIVQLQVSNFSICKKYAQTKLMRGLLSEALRLAHLFGQTETNKRIWGASIFLCFSLFSFPPSLFPLHKFLLFPPSPLSPSHRFLLFSDGWWCIAGVSQAESLLQTEPNLTFTAAACQAHQNLFSRMNPS